MDEEMRQHESSPVLTVVVPVLNEADSLPAFLRAVQKWPAECALVFCDGGSTDATHKLLEGHRVVGSECGRGIQCRKAAEVVKGSDLAFVHADSIIEPKAICAIVDALRRGVQWGCLTLSFHNADLLLSFGAYMSNLRVKLSGIAFGDQVIFVKRELYNQVGGMPDLPLMEDYELSCRLRDITRPIQLREKVITSARRFSSDGVVRTMLKMRYLRHLYRLGVSPRELAQRYGMGR